MCSLTTKKLQDALQGRRVAISSLFLTCISQVSKISTVSNKSLSYPYFINLSIRNTWRTYWFTWYTWWPCYTWYNDTYDAYDTYDTLDAPEKLWYTYYTRYTWCLSMWYYYPIIIWGGDGNTWRTLNLLDALDTLDDLDTLDTFDTHDTLDTLDTIDTSYNL